MTLTHNQVEGVDSSTPVQQYVSRWNWLWIFFGIIGGIAGNLLVHDRDPKFARRLLIGGVIVSLVSGALMWGAYFIVVSRVNQSQVPVKTPTAQASAAAPTLAFASPIPAQERESDSPTQVADDLSLLLVGAYEAGNPGLATTYLDNVYACRDDSCGFTESVGQISVVHLLHRIPGGDIVTSNGVTSNGANQVSGSTTTQTTHATVTLNFTAQWDTTSNEWLATSLYWQSVPS